MDVVSSDKSMSPAQPRPVTEAEITRLEKLCDKVNWDDERKPTGDKADTGRLLS